MTSRLQEIKRHWEEMKRFPNDNPGYAFAVADIAYLIELVENVAKEILDDIEIIISSKPIDTEVPYIIEYIEHSRKKYLGDEK